MKRIGVFAIIVILLAVVVGLAVSPEKRDAKPSYSSQPCREHGVADSLCTRCHPDLISLFKERGDWCAEHKLPESQCYLCHPELRTGSLQPSTPHDHSGHAHEAAEDSSAGEQPSSVAIDWCAEHRVPESECTLCHPELVAAFKTKGDWCGGHKVPESHCYLCNPDLKFPQEAQYEKARTPAPKKPTPPQPRTSLFRSNVPHCKTDDAIIQLASVQTANRSGLIIEPVQESLLAATIDVPAEVEFDATTSYAVSSLVGGTLTRWLVTAGEHVLRGQILAYLESIEGASLRADYDHAVAVLALAKQEFDRQKELSSGGLVSHRELQQAESEYRRAQADDRKARSALRAIGFSEEDLRQLGEDADLVEIPIRARHSGTLAEQRVELGAILAAGESIGLIAETGKLWVEARVRERELPRVKAGQRVNLSSDGEGWNRCAGVVTWVADAIDPATRMGRVRIETEPNGSSLRAHQFVQAHIEVGDQGGFVTLPSEAVQWEGCCNIVFVEETRDRFRPRKVNVELANGNRYAVTGLQPGERIVTRGSYLLKTELMKGSLGAGCCGVGA